MSESQIIYLPCEQLDAWADELAEIWTGLSLIATGQTTYVEGIVSESRQRLRAVLEGMAAAGAKVLPPPASE